MEMAEPYNEMCISHEANLLHLQVRSLDFMSKARLTNGVGLINNQKHLNLNIKKTCWGQGAKFSESTDPLVPSISSQSRSPTAGPPDGAAGLLTAGNQAAFQSILTQGWQPSGLTVNYPYQSFLHYFDDDAPTKQKSEVQSLWRQKQGRTFTCHCGLWKKGV